MCHPNLAARIVAKQDQAFRNSRLLATLAAGSYCIRRAKDWRRFTYWMQVGQRWQDQAIKHFN